MTTSGWCAAAPGARTKCHGCRWALCSCPCHNTTDDKSKENR